jgi:hypothetical protein
MLHMGCSSRKDTPSAVVTTADQEQQRQGRQPEVMYDSVITVITIIPPLLQELRLTRSMLHMGCCSKKDSSSAATSAAAGQTTANNK